MAVINRSTPFKMESSSASQLAKRSIMSDKIRHLSPSSPLLMFVSSGFNIKGENVKVKGYMNKKPTSRILVEEFYSMPKSYTMTPTAVSAAGATPTATFSSVDEIVPRMWFRAPDGSTGVVTGVNTSTKVATFAVLGGTSFAPEANKSLLLMGILSEENSLINDYTSKEDDRIVNYCGNFRHGLGISMHKYIEGNGGELAGGNFYDRKCKEDYDHAMHLFESALLFGKMPVSGESTSVTTTTGKNTGTFNVFHNEGIYNMAQNEYDFSGSPSLQKLLYNLPRQLHDSLNSTSNLLFLCSDYFFDTINSLAFDKMSFQVVPAYKELEKWSIKMKSFSTSKGVITLAVDHAFCNDALRDVGLIIEPDAIDYCYFKEKDIRMITEGKEENDRDGKIGDISFSGCLLPSCGGHRVTRVINCL